MAIRKIEEFKTEVYEDIMTIIDNLSMNSKNTFKSYMKDVEDFFNFITEGKNIKVLTIDDLKVRNIDVQEYQNRLHKDLNNGKGYSPSTINRKMSSVRKLYKKLEANDYPVRSVWFDVTVAKGESKSWEVINWDIVLSMMEEVVNTEKGLIKSTLIETAVVTCFRKNELLNLRWENVKNIDGTWVLEVESGKGNKSNLKPINENLYERLQMIRTIGSDKVFNISDTTIKAMMRNLREKLNLSNKVAFHSLKKCGINEVYLITGGDIMAVAEQGNHASFATTMKHYMDMKKDFKSMPNLQIGNNDDLMDEFENLSHEELLNAIRESSRSTKMDILRKVKELG